MLFGGALAYIPNLEGPYHGMGNKKNTLIGDHWEPLLGTDWVPHLKDATPAYLVKAKSILEIIPTAAPTIPTTPTLTKPLPLTKVTIPLIPITININ